MAIAIVQHSSASGFAPQTTPAANFSAATSIIVIVGDDATFTGALPTTSPANTLVTRASPANNEEIFVLDALSSPSVSAAMTATFNDGGAFTSPVIALLGLTGCGGYDGSPDAGNVVGGPTSFSHNPFTPAQSGDLLIAVAVFSSPVSGLVIPSGFTSLVSLAPASQTVIATQLYNSTSPITVSWSWTTTFEAVEFCLLAYKPSGGGASAPGDDDTFARQPNGLYARVEPVITVYM